MEKEAPSSFLVTGTLQLSATVAVDSSAYLTPDWLTYVIRQSNPVALALAAGQTEATVRVPGRVSYGFDVRTLAPEVIHLERNRRVRVELPPLAIHSVEPDLTRLEVRTASRGWMRLFSSETQSAVRDRALTAVQEALRAQAQAHIGTATQPRVNTARALAAMLRPPLVAAGLPEPQFVIEIDDNLVYTPNGDAAPEAETSATDLPAPETDMR